MWVNNLPKVITRQCPGAELNLRPELPQDYKSDTLPLAYRATEPSSVANNKLIENISTVSSGVYP